MTKQIFCSWLKTEEAKGDPEFMGCQGCLNQLTCAYFRINKKLRKMEDKKK